MLGTAVVAIALQTHEFQHAPEIAASGVRDDRALAKLLDGIGERRRYRFDTNDAREVGARVGRELSAQSPKLIADRRLTNP